MLFGHRVSRNGILLVQHSGLQSDRCCTRLAVVSASAQHRLKVLSWSRLGRKLSRLDLNLRGQSLRIEELIISRVTAIILNQGTLSLARDLWRAGDLGDRSRRCRDRVLGDLGRGNGIDRQSVGLCGSLGGRGMLRNSIKDLGRRGFNLKTRLAFYISLLEQ